MTRPFYQPIPAPPELRELARDALVLAWAHGIHAGALATACQLSAPDLALFRLGRRGISEEKAGQLLRVLCTAPEGFFGHGVHRSKEAELMQTLEGVRHEVRVIERQLSELEVTRQRLLRRVEVLHIELLKGQRRSQAPARHAGRPGAPVEGP